MELWFTRYRAAFALGHLGLALVALHFGVVVYFGGSPMTPELYGAAVYAIPAIVWALAQLGGEGLSVLGATLGGRRGAYMMLVGSTVVLPFYAFLGAAAMLAGQGVIVTAACLWLTGPFSMFSIAASIGAIKDAR